MKRAAKETRVRAGDLRGVAAVALAAVVVAGGCRQRDRGTGMVRESERDRTGERRLAAN